MEIRLQVVCRGCLAARPTDTGNDQVAQNLVPDPVEADAVIHLVQDELGTVKGNGRDVIQHTLNLQPLSLPDRTAGKVQHTLPVSRAYPFRGLGHEKVGFLVSLHDTETLHLLVAAVALVYHYDTDSASPVFLLAWEHGAKVAKNPASPKSPSQKLQKALFIGISGKRVCRKC